MQQLLDFIIVGSGFGGSVSALRLTEKGYSVAVIEQGKRWAKEDFAENNWNLRKFIWRPSLGLHGILQMTVTSDVFFLHGAGVGGGSLVYANTLIEPPAQAFDDPQWIGGRWQVDLAPYYTLAKRMLGAVVSPVIVHTDRVLKEVAEEMGRGDTFHAHDVGVYFGEPGITKADPFFDGKGPERTGCTLCGGCMVGCRVGAKNTLDQNYLYLAEKLGAMIVPEIKVIDIVPLGEGDPRSAPIDARANGSNGYELTIEKSMGLIKSRERVRTRGVVLSAGSFGTVDLLFRCKDRGTLPNVSDKLGDFVRTNSEALVGVVSKDKNVDYSKGIAITSGAFVDDSTHVEIVRYPAGSDAMALLTTPLTDDGPEMSRPVRWLKAIFANPGQAIRALAPFGWAKRTAILLVMQPVNNYLRYRLKRSWWWPFRKTLDTALVGGQKVPVYLPQANKVARRMAEKMNAVPQSGILEVLFGKATTAHILGGCPIGATEETGVVDPDHKLFGYENFYVADGSVIPANLGVNPSLTITAMSERAMAKVEPKGGAGDRKDPSVGNNR